MEKISNFILTEDESHIILCIKIYTVCTESKAMIDHNNGQ